MKTPQKPTKNLPKKSFGSFSGVFVPTFLSIIGVIMYLRLGFVVGQAGVFGSILIILIATSITFSTGLSLSSITTNIRIGGGAVYSIVSKTLGIEVGGSVGIPLYLAQVFSVALYILGFAEGWQFIFPEHPYALVVSGAFVTLFTLIFISTQIAIKAQILVFVLTLASLASIFAGGGNWVQNLSSTPLLGSFSENAFWPLFALFFPAVTGLMAGIGLSGELSDPKKQIPRGVLSSLTVTTLIYIIMVFWFAHSAAPEDLSSNNLIIVDLAFNGPVVLAGILAATFSSALTTFVAAPRLLQALSENRILPMSSAFAKRSSNGEPRNATIFTSVLIALSLLSGSLDVIAPVLTMFFLITYAMINLVVFIEQSLGLPSFRPTFRVPRAVSLYGAVASIAIMFLISAIAGLVAIIFLFATYLSLVKRNLKTQEGDVRSGLFRSLAEWAAKKVQTLPESEKHTWKPNILLPALNSPTVFGNFPLIQALAFPHGTMTVLAMKVERKNTQPNTEVRSLDPSQYDLDELQTLVEKFGNEGIFTSSSIVEATDYSKAVAIALEAIESQVFHPNILFLPFKPRQLTHRSLEEIMESAEKHQVSVILFDRDEEMSLGSQQDIHVWIPPEVLTKDFYADRKFDLAMLCGYKLQRNWKGNLTLWMCVKKEEEEQARHYLKKLIYEARLPLSTEIRVVTMSFMSALKQAPHGDIHIISMTSEEIMEIKKIAKIPGKSFLFVSDSKNEDILA